MHQTDASQPAGPGMPDGPIIPQPLPLAWSTGLADLLRHIESAMPVTEVLHAIQAQLPETGELHDLPAMQQFTQTSLQNLRAQVAIAGFARRILSGDTGADVLEGLRRQVAALVRTHTAMNRLLAEVASAPEASGQPIIQSMLQVLALGDQAFRAMEPLLRPLVSPDIFEAFE